MIICNRNDFLFAILQESWLPALLTAVSDNYSLGISLLQKKLLGKFIIVANMHVLPISHEI